MLKLVGACLIMVSAAGIGVSFSTDLKRRCQELRILKQLAYMLRGEIKFTKTPLPEAFSHISVRLPEPLGTSFPTWRKRLEQLTEEPSVSCGGKR